MVATYIPAGRTSLVKKRGLSLQIQTEYARIPVPRITTTILRDGQVLHKVQRELENQITTLELQASTEEIIKRQHAEVISILKSDSNDDPLGFKDKIKTEEKTLDCGDALKAISGVHSVYRLDNEGRFKGSNTSEHFKEKFSPLFQDIHALLDIFSLVPGIGITREKGIYEIEASRLYLVSVGLECFFVVISSQAGQHDYEQEIRKAVLIDS